VICRRLPKAIHGASLWLLSTATTTGEQGRTIGGGGKLRQATAITASTGGWLQNRCVYFSHASVNIVAHSARTHPSDSLDFIYVDARHDYCGVKEDLINWWPKLKKHGIMCGHDYMTGFQQLKARGSYR